MENSTLQHVKQVVSEQGSIPFSAFMREALYGPCGYYNQAVQIGGAGADFYTASRLPLFGWTLGAAIQRRWENSGRPERLQIVELGAGQGELAESILSSIGAHMAHVSVEYVILDVSPRLMEAQRQRLNRFASPDVHVRWENPAADVETVLIANEVLDALVAERVKRTREGWLRGMVEHRDGNLLMSWVAADEDLAAMATRWLPIPVNSEGELCTVLPQFFRRCRSLAERMTAWFIDYGITLMELKEGVRPNGTVRGYLRHEVVDPLAFPGICDITADVHWDFASDSAAEAGFHDVRLEQQGSFLMREGIMDVLQDRLTTGNESVSTKLTGQLKQLVLPGGMGERFAVMECCTD